MHVPHPIVNTDFIVGVDNFSDLEIADGGDGHFFYFKNTKKTLVKRFVLKQTDRTQKHCSITLIMRSDGVFEPRFDFEILDLTKGAVKNIELPVLAGETRLVKAKVNFTDCHESFSDLLGFVRDFEGVELSGSAFAVVSTEVKAQLSELMEAVGKDSAVAEFAGKYGGKVTEKDLNLIAGRKKALETFHRLLSDEPFFEECKSKLGSNKRDEDVWQTFFERNTWIFGYGLQLVCCEPLDDQKLETIVVGSDLIDGAGKRTDALLKTRGWVSRTLFCEIKTHKTPLLRSYPRTSVFIAGDDLQGAIGQVQKAIHKVGLKLSTNLKKLADKEGNPTGEELAFIRPRGLVIAGRLDQFETSKGLNEEQLSSFELYRQQLTGVEIITFDELYERARFIVED